MKVLKLLIIASVLTYAAARVVGPQLVDSRKKTKLQSKQEDDEGVIVDPVITVSDIQVYEVTTSSTAASVEENSVEISSSSSAESSTESEAAVNEDDANPINRYCKCTSYECDCCREFSLPLVPIRGPGCANIRYLEGDRMSIGIKFGNRVLANRIISGRKETPVCLPLPGGFTNFCGRIYGISKKNEEFKACLGLELRADEEVEAALRVSCFSFGPRGLKVMEAEPIPVAAPEEEEEDDDDIFGFGSEDDDEDDDILEDEDDTPSGQSAGNVAESSDDGDDDDDTDYTGLSLLSGDIFDDILGDDEDQSDKPSRKTPKKKTKGSVKLPQGITSESQNEVDGTEAPNDDDDDAEEDEDESGGILDILDDLISDGDEEEDDEDEKVEDEVSEEIAENELDDDAEEVVEETDETSPAIAEKDNEIESESDLEEEELAEAVADDDDDIEDDDDDEEEIEGKPSGYAGLSLLGLRNLFSRFFH